MTHTVFIDPLATDCAWYLRQLAALEEARDALHKAAATYNPGDPNRPDMWALRRVVRYAREDYLEAAQRLRKRAPDGGTITDLPSFAHDMLLKSAPH
jgi:hypothetical protein